MIAYRCYFDFLDLIAAKLVKLQDETIIDLYVGFMDSLFIDVICSSPRKEYSCLRQCLGGDEVCL